MTVTARIIDAEAKEIEVARRYMFHVSICSE